MSALPAINPKSKENFYYRVSTKKTLTALSCAAVFAGAFTINYFLNDTTDVIKFVNTETMQIGMSVAGGLILIALLTYGRYGKKLCPKDQKAQDLEQALNAKDMAHQKELRDQLAARDQTHQSALEAVTAEKNRVERDLRAANAKFITQGTELEAEKAKLVTRNQEYAALESTLGTRTGELAQATATATSLTTELATASRTIKDLQTRAEKNEETIGALSQRLTSKTAEAEQLRQQLDGESSSSTRGATSSKRGGCF